jgi:DNA invertase Pin-like site-specific DNA recombinase
MIMGYCRAFKLEPPSSLARQKATLAAAGAQIFFSERTSGTGGAPELERAVAAMRSGDTLIVTRPYRVARSTRGVLALIENLGKKGAGLRILGTPVDTSTTTGRMILGSTPLWSLNMSPARAALLDLMFGWRGLSKH